MNLFILKDIFKHDIKFIFYVIYLLSIKKINMNRHLSLRSGNPVLSSKTFSNTILSDNQMTIEGTVNKTAISLLLLVGTGYFTFDVVNPVLLVGCGIGGFVIAIITVFKKNGLQ